MGWIHYIPACCLDAFPMDDGWAGFIIFLLADPHLLEGGERSHDGASDPGRVFPLWCDDLDLHCCRSEGRDLLLHAVGHTGEHGRTSGQNNVGIQVPWDVHVASHY